MAKPVRLVPVITEPAVVTAAPVVPVVRLSSGPRAMVAPVVTPVTAAMAVRVLPAATPEALAATAATPVRAGLVARRRSVRTAMAGMLAWQAMAVSAVPARRVRPAQTAAAPVRAAMTALTVAPVVSAERAAPVRQAALRVAVAVAVPPRVLTRSAVTAAMAVAAPAAVSAATVWPERQVSPRAWLARPAATAARAAMAVPAVRAARPGSAAGTPVTDLSAMAETPATVVRQVTARAAAVALRLWWRAGPVLTAVMAAMAVPVVLAARLGLLGV